MPVPKDMLDGENIRAGGIEISGETNIDGNIVQTGEGVLHVTLYVITKSSTSSVAERHVLEVKQPVSK
jgi:hypothetical protein